MKKRMKSILAGAASLAGLGIVAGLVFAVADRTQTGSGATVADVAVRVPVVTTPLATRVFEDRVTVQGTLESKYTTLVSALVPGTLEEIFVDEGDIVVAGQTPLFQTDALKLEKALEVSRQDLAMARLGRKERAAYQERIVADFEKAKIDYERHQLLYENKSISIDALEQQQSRYRQAVAMCKHAQSLLDTAVEQEQQAESALAIAEKSLKDTLVVAPLNGVVSLRFLEPGEMANAGTPVLKIEDPSVIEASAYLPAQYFARVTPGETKIRVKAYEVEVDERVVSFKSPTINPKLRTFEVKCLIEQPPAGVVSGAMADITVLFDQRSGLGVPKEAIQIREDRSAIFAVEDGIARLYPVETGIETGGMVEVRGEGLREGLEIVTMGQFHVEDGSAVQVRQEAR